MQTVRVRDPEPVDDLIGPRRPIVAGGRGVIDLRQRSVDLVRIRRHGQPQTERFIAEDRREPGHHADVLFGERGQADHEVGPLLSPQHTLRELRDGETGPAHGGAALIGPVRQRYPVPEVRRHDTLARPHLRDVLARHAARLHQHPTDDIDGRVRVGRCRAHAHRRRWKDLDAHGFALASDVMSSPACKLFSNRSEASLFMKFLNFRTTACAGATLRARSARLSCATTISASAGI